MLWSSCPRPPRKPVRPSPPTPLFGGPEYQNGETKELAGVRLLDPYTYSIQIAADYANYYYAFSYASLVSSVPADVRFR